MEEPVVKGRHHSPETRLKMRRYTEAERIERRRIHSRDSARLFRKRHPEEHKAYMRVYCRNRYRRMTLNPEWRKKQNKHQVKYAARNPEKILLLNALNRSRRKKIPFSITEKDIVIPLMCPVLGIPLFRDGGERTPNSPSLDEIIPGKGYVLGNIQVISWRANCIKRDATLDELEKLVAYIQWLRSGGAGG